MAPIATASVAVEIGGFQGIVLTPNVALIKTNIGKTAAFAVKVESVNDFAGDVAFSVEGVPAGITVAIQPPRLTVAPGYDLGTTVELAIPNDEALKGTLTVKINAEEVPPEEAP